MRQGNENEKPETKDGLDKKFNLPDIPKSPKQEKENENLQESKAIKASLNQELMEQESNMRSFQEALQRSDDRKLNEKGPLDDPPEMMVYHKLPKQYKDLIKYSGYKPTVNIGHKWGDIVQKGVETQLAKERRLRKVGPIAEGLMTRKLGVDRFFLGFAVIGAFLIPVAIYLHQRTRKALVQRRLGKRPGEIEDLEEFEEDIDDISGHVCYYDLEEMRREKRKALNSIKEKLELEKEVYGTR